MSEELKQGQSSVPRGSGTEIKPQRIRLVLSDLVRRGNSDPQLGGVVTPLIDLLSLAAVFLALFGKVAGAAAALGLTIVALVALSFPLPGLTSTKGTGPRMVCRLLSTVAIGSIAVSLQRVDPAAVTALLALAAATAVEAPLNRMQLYSQSAVSGLPGFTPHISGRFPSGLAPLLNLASLVMAGATVLLGFTWIPTLLLALSTLCLVGAELVLLLARVFSLAREGAALRRALEAYRPRFALYWRAEVGTDYQISMWLPYLEQLGKPFIVIVRTMANYDEAVRLTDRPVVLRRTMNELDDVLVRSLKTVFYVNNAGSNTQMVRYPGLRHIMLNHGDSDKAPSYNPVSRMYDRNFVAGQAAIDRFGAHDVEAFPQQFRIVGRPQIADIATASSSITELARPTVLYAPTWAGFTTDAQYSSLPWGPAIVAALLREGCNVIFRPHPYAYRTAEFREKCDEIRRLLAADQAPEAEHVYGAQAETDWSITQCFDASDAMISDVSSVANDYLEADKPLALTVINSTVEKFTSENSLASGSYLLEEVGGQIVNLDAVLEKLLRSDPLREQRKALKTYVLGDPGGEPYVNLFLREAATYI